MKRVLATILALTAVTLVGRAQPPTQSDVPAVPVEQEPRHRLVFVNEFVRVIEAILPPLYVSQNHTHAYDNVAVVILPGIDGPQGQARTGFAGFSRGGYTHVVTNPNTGVMRFIDVELRAADRTAPAGIEPPDQAGHSLVLNNARVRLMRVKLGPGETVPEHQHGAGYVSVVVRGGDGPGTWKWHPASEPPATLAAGRQPLEIVEIEPK